MISVNIQLNMGKGNSGGELQSQREKESISLPAVPLHKIGHQGYKLKLRLKQTFEDSSRHFDSTYEQHSWLVVRYKIFKCYSVATPFGTTDSHYLMPLHVQASP